MKVSSNDGRTFESTSGCLTHPFVRPHNTGICKNERELFLQINYEISLGDKKSKRLWPTRSFPWENFPLNATCDENAAVTHLPVSRECD